MLLHLFDHREHKPTFLFAKQEGAETATIFEGKEAEKKVMESFFNEEELKELTKKSPEEVRQFVDEKFEERFGKESYENELEQHFKSYRVAPMVKERLMKDSMARYEANYRSTLARFYRHTESKISHFEDLMEETRSSTRDELSKLSQAIENVQAVESSTPELENVVNPVEKLTFGGTWAHKIPLVGPLFEHTDIPILSPVITPAEYREYREFQGETTGQFISFTEALSDQFLNPDLMEDHLTKDELDEYKTLAGHDWFTDGFSDGMEDYVEKQLKDIFENTKDADELKKQLTLLRGYIVERYTTYANEDGLIDLHELRRLNREASRFVDLTSELNKTEDPEEIIRLLEANQFMKPEVLERATGVMLDQMLKDSIRNGTETHLIQFVEEKTGESDLSFRQASNKLDELMKDRVESGAVALTELITELNEAVNGERVEFLKIPETDSKAMKGLALKQRDLILSRRIEPKNVDDRLVAEFMSTGFLGRKTMLDNKTERAALFQAIQSIKEHYPRIYNERHQSSISETTDIRYSDDPSDPSGHDKIARLLAMTALAKEAGWIVGNLSSSEDFKEENLSVQLEETEIDETPPKIYSEFRDRLKMHSTRYRTQASRSGFNGRDIALNGLKVLGGITLLINYMNFRKEYGTIEGAIKLTTNPWAALAAGTVYGAHKVQDRPEVAGYLFESEGSQERIATTLGLDSLSKKIGRHPLLSFIGNANEFKAMSSLMKDPQEGVNIIGQLNKKAVERDGKNPVITKDDLKEALNTATGSDAVWSQLPNFSNDRTRYLFYSKFLTKARNVRQLKHNCETWI